MVSDDYVIRWQVNDVDIAQAVHDNVTIVHVSAHRVIWATYNTTYLFNAGRYYEFATTQQTTAVPVCGVRVHVSDEFVSQAGSNQNARELVSNILHLTSTIYESTAQIVFALDSFQVYTGNVDDNDITTTFSTYKATAPNTQNSCASILFDVNLYASHIVGIATVSGLCTSTHHAIVSIAEVEQMTVVLAHELGHLFGAQHVTSYEACSTLNTIMSPSISGVDNVFSTCVATVLRDTVRDKAACFSTVDPVTPAPTTSSDSVDINVIVGAIVGGLAFLAVIIVYVVHHNTVYKGRDANTDTTRTPWPQTKHVPAVASSLT